MTQLEGALPQVADIAQATAAEQLHSLFSEYVDDSQASWSVGTFGAIAEFHRDADEAAEVVIDGSAYCAFTRRGAVRLTMVPGLRAFAYETVGSQPGQWSHAIALCLPSGSATMHRRERLTELGADTNAVRSEDRTALLFDMGLACPQVDLCVRSANPEVLARLRAGAGRSLLEPDNALMGEMPRLSPHRVFVCRFARVEVYQPVPPPDGTSPMGPHTHVLPKLMREGRTHSANAPIPAGWVPCAHLYPPHPARDAHGRPQPFNAQVHRRFQQLLMQHGDPVLWQLKRRVIDAIDQSEPPWMKAADLSRHQRAAVRIGVRQAAVAGKPPVALSAWLAQFETSADDSAES